MGQNLSWTGMEALHKARQHWLVKQASSVCSTGKTMVQRRKWSMAKCPRCDCEVEDSEHILLCKGSGAKEQWEQGLSALASWMRHTGTAVDVNQAIIQGLDSWYNGSLPPDTEGCTAALRQAVDQQSNIGWRALLEGCPAVGWAEVQQSYYRTFGSKRDRPSVGCCFGAEAC